MKVVPNLCGHGIGTFFHGPPSIYHTLNNYPGVMKPGMVFTIEPCLSDGVARVSLCPEDGRSLLTTDQARTAQFEHTILVTEVGVEILTA